MKRFLLFFVMVLLSFFATAQKKVAVMEVKAYDGVKQMHAVMIRGGLETAVGNTPGYETYDRSNFEAIMQEQNFQRSGAVKDSDIKRLGELAGVQYIIVPEASAGDGQIYILVKMLDVETGKFGGVKEKLCEASSQEIKNACAELGKALFDTGTQGQKSKTDVATTSDKTTTTQKKTTPVMTSGPVKNEFSVSDGKKVEFSKGNLQYQASTGTWRFAGHQWDYIGQANEKIGKRNSGWIDLFDWGVYNKISNGGNKNWRTLKDYEWKYVFQGRKTSSGIRFAKAQVNGVNGVILLPDNWYAGIYELNDTDNVEAAYKTNIISQADWTNKFDANGAVFLPAAGRFSNYDKIPKKYRPDSPYSDVGICGYYWSASSYVVENEGAYHIEFNNYFSKYDIRLDAHTNRDARMSVRLVSDIY